MSHAEEPSLSVRRTFHVEVSQSLTVSSQLPLANMRPSGEKATDET